MQTRARRSFVGRHGTVASWVVAALGVTLGAASAHAQRITLPGTQPGTLRAPLLAAAQCSECHGGVPADDGHAYMPADLWPASMMANAVRDPLFRATLVTAEQDRPGLGEYCLRCHTPAGFTSGRAQAGRLDALDPLQDNDGVHCDSCHRSIDASTRMPNPDPMAPYVANAQLVFDDAPAGMSPTRHGPRTDPFLSNRHPSVGDPFIRDSRMCGQCHDVDNPVVHLRAADGSDTGIAYPLQSTYSEWAQSNFARPATLRTCQDCHMPQEPMPQRVVQFTNAPLRTDHRRHEFLGANEWGMALLRAAYPDELDDAYDALRVRTRAFLQTSALLEVVDPPTTVAANGTLHLTVRVTNQTGHKLPTGYEDARLMWLQVQVGDQVVSGAMAEDELVEDTQLHAYRFIPGHLEGGRPVPDDFVARHEIIIEDTRLPPEGMMPNARTMPVGRDYSGGANGALRHVDTASFDVPAPAVAGPVTVTVRLMYRTTTRHYVETIAGANRTGDEGTRLLAAWNASGRAAPFAMATQTATVQVMPGTTPPDAGGTDGAANADANGLGDGATRDGGNSPISGGCACSTHGATRGQSTGAIALALAAVVTSARRRRRASRAVSRVQR